MEERYTYEYFNILPVFIASGIECLELCNVYANVS